MDLNQRDFRLAGFSTAPLNRAHLLFCQPVSGEVLEYLPAVLIRDVLRSFIFLTTSMRIMPTSAGTFGPKISAR